MSGEEVKLESEPQTENEIELTPEQKSEEENDLSKPETDVDILQEMRDKLKRTIDGYFDEIAETLYYNSQLQEDLFFRLKDAKDLLQQRYNAEENIGRVEFEVKRVGAVVAKEKQIQLGEKRLSWIVPSLVLAYIIIIIATIFWGGQIWTDTTQIPIIGVPLSVLVWSAIGSLAAILYRFYTQKPKKVSDEVKWLIARPVIGIIMGALAYVAIISGLLIFGTTVGQEFDINNARPQTLWLVAFLGGFSDKFFETIIDNVMGRFSNETKREDSGNGREKSSVTVIG
ncbi:MAG: hypothetical protein KDJ65_23260 [Anaerolineae bacterium]|nr:hypothetical protein [Anaerolineae bacterium]